MFQLDHRLEADTQLLGAFPLSLLLLSKDANYPWCILVPKREGMREIYQLNKTDRQQLLDESCLLAETLSDLFGADKINVATIGNMVPQLHMHHVVRFENDAAWPGPVWGAAAAAAYPPQLFSETAASIVAALAPLGLQTEQA
ncbi:HIT domain-containing protein [Porticoccaceae bacterium]|nr:HIT domain-containing protein [Porticoccaceae bacterium]MDB9804860.1 HIT domain-containing protein [Porticoccaceae bacterium]MDB9949252.1 HIT domain-containing protein [Porticoccaceae bacterium]MDB9969631.1 HIT domain-containing protein [Porticoccaceae bacterium]MDC0010957.1 HIT domain-containing protein [Porticoccaceae bacterium]